MSEYCWRKFLSLFNGVLRISVPVTIWTIIQHLPPRTCTETTGITDHPFHSLLDSFENAQLLHQHATKAWPAAATSIEEQRNLNRKPNRKPCLPNPFSFLALTLLDTYEFHDVAFKGSRCYHHCQEWRPLQLVPRPIHLPGL